jgi:hypothetical protein
MGSMRQLASMMRHVHEAHALGGVEEEDPAGELPALPDQAEITRAIAELEARLEPVQAAYPRD